MQSVYVIKHSQSKNILVVPDLDQVVTTTGDEPALLTRSGVGADQAAGKGGGSPANGVDTHTVGVEGLVSPVVVRELEHADMAIGGSASKETSALMGSPGDHVHGSRVKGEVEDLRP
jgi:hypothetical protein